jgi:hypothetical protein
MRFPTAGRDSGTGNMGAIAKHDRLFGELADTLYRQAVGLSRPYPDLSHKG